MSAGREPPQAVRYVVVGAGVHGLSTAWHLARGQRARGASPDVVVVDYPSVLVEGERDCGSYLHDLLGDWQAPGITTVLHEHRGGYADSRAAIEGLAAKAEAEGVRILSGLRVTGFYLGGADGPVRAVATDRGTIRCEQVVLAAGPWVRDLWSMLGLPDRIDVTDGAGAREAGGERSDRRLVRRDVEMWTYLLLQEGTVGMPPDRLTAADGSAPPVLHVDSDAPLYDENGDLVTDQMWGIYYKPDRVAGGVHGGTVPVAVDTPTTAVRVDPYGPESPEFTSPPGFARMWTSALAHCQRRFEGTAGRFRHERSGGLGCFTPDRFPVFDTFRQNALVIADSNHGFKLIGVGALVAAELLGEPQELLAPFRFDRFRRGDLHPTSNSPFPWS